MTDDRQTAALYALTASIDGLRDDVRDERKGRRLSVALIAFALVFGALLGVREYASQQDEARAACTTRSESRADVRAAIAVAIDEGAKELGAADDERVALGKRVDTAVLEQLPPPDC